MISGVWAQARLRNFEHEGLGMLGLYQVDGCEMRSICYVRRCSFEESCIDSCSLRLCVSHRGSLLKPWVLRMGSSLHGCA